MCGVSFRPEDDVYARREHLGFAHWGYAELVGFTLIGLLLAAGLGALALTVHWSFFVAQFAVWLVLIEIVWFFRDPRRLPPTDPAAVASPADGTVSHVETITDPDFPTPMIRISIFLSIFNVHVNRIPPHRHDHGRGYFRGEFLTPATPISAPTQRATLARYDRRGHPAPRYG